MECSMTRHIPRGQMCITCTALYKDCSHLDFVNMRVIEKEVPIDDEFYQIVKCNEYSKIGEK